MTAPSWPPSRLGAQSKVIGRSRERTPPSGTFSWRPSPVGWFSGAIGPRQPFGRLPSVAYAWSMDATISRTPFGFSGSYSPGPQR